MNVIPLRQPRDLSHILRDCEHAKKSRELALDKMDQQAWTRADKRLDELREEFDARLQETTGITVREIEDAFSKAVI
jgi:hypothetical protein